jgi:hypothetical protein
VRGVATDQLIRKQPGRLIAVLDRDIARVDEFYAAEDAAGWEGIGLRGTDKVDGSALLNVHFIPILKSSILNSLKNWLHFKCLFVLTSGSRGPHSAIPCRHTQWRYMLRAWRTNAGA